MDSATLAKLKYSLCMVALQSVEQLFITTTQYLTDCKKDNINTTSTIVLDENFFGYGEIDNTIVEGITFLMVRYNFKIISVDMINNTMICILNTNNCIDLKSTSVMFGAGESDKDNKHLVLTMLARRLYSIYRNRVDTECQ